MVTFEAAPLLEHSRMGSSSKRSPAPVSTMRGEDAPGPTPTAVLTPALHSLPEDVISSSPLPGGN